MPSGDSASRIDARRRKQIVRTYAAMAHMLDQLERIVREGAPPSGVGSPLTPPPREVADALEHELECLGDRLRAAIAARAPDELAEHEKRLPLAVTYMWIANLLQRMRETAETLQPSWQRRYGELSPAASQALEELCAEVAGAIADAEAAILQAMGLRGGQPADARQPERGRQGTVHTSGD